MTGVPPRLRQKPRARRSALLALLAAGASLLVAERGSATNPIVTTITTAGETAYVIPANTISLQVTVVGAPGASAGVSAGHPVGTPGNGAMIVATMLPPTGVSTLYVEVGDSRNHGGGGTSDYAARGGGASAIQTCAINSAGCTYNAVAGGDPRLIVAAGGGGGGQASFVTGNGGNGGDGYLAGTSGPGAGGDGTDSGNGDSGAAGGLETTSTTAALGAGSAKCGATGNGGSGGPGTGGTGGDYDNGDSAVGGGGGGGWIGGSGGGAGECPLAGATGSGGGGGGGSSYVLSAATNVTTSVATGSPEVIIAATVGVPPVITSAASTTFITGTAGSFTVTTTGTPPPSLSETGALPSGVTFVDNGDGTATLSGTPGGGTGGNYGIMITTMNGFPPNATQSFALTVGQAPVVTSAAAATFSVGVAGSFLATTTGYPTASVSQTGTLPGGMTFTDNGNGTATLSGTPAAGTGGVWPITITATNGVAPDGSQSFSLTVDAAPKITSAATTTFTVATAGSFQVTTTGPPAPGLSESGALPAGVTLHDNGNGTATLAGTPHAGTGGSYPFTITAVNGLSPNARQSFTLTVDQAPAITSAASATFTVGHAGTFLVTSTGFPQPSFSDGSDALPGGVTFVDNGNGTATLSGTPAAGSGGPWPFSVIASNGVSPNATQSFTLTVDQGPAITSANAATFTIGQPGTFTVTTTGTPAPALSETGALPSGVTFHDNGNGTATLAGTPAAGTTGAAAFSIAANNGISANATQSFTLTVDEAPAITSAAGTTFSSGQHGTWTVTATGDPVPSLSETGALPTGVTFVDNGNGTATLAGTPPGGSGGTHALTITASNGVSPEATQSFTLTVDQSLGIQSLASTTFTAGQPGTFAVRVTGFPVPSLSDGGATLPTGVTFVDNGNGTATLAGTPATGTGGTYPFIITASSGGTNLTQHFTLTVNQLPAITSAATTTFVTGRAGTWTVTATGFPVPTLSDNGATLPAGVTFVDNGNGTATLAGTPAAGTGGMSSFLLTASNGGSPNATQSFVLLVDQGPVILSAASTTFTAGQAGTWAVMTSGFPTASLTETGALPSGVTFVDNGDGTATLAGTPPAGSGGAYDLMITASNGVSTAALQSFTLKVDQTVAIASTSTATFVVGQAGSATIAATGFPVPALSDGGATLPGGVSFVDNGNGTATLGGIPAVGSGGVYMFVVTANNGSSPATTQSFTLTVDAGLTFTSAATATFTVGQLGTATITATGFPAPMHLTTSGELPPGVTFTDGGNGSGTLSGTPAAGTGGPYPITITASNASTPSATQHFVLTVDTASVITSAASTTFTVGQAGTFTFQATGVPAPTLSVSGTALPGGITFHANSDGTATMSGTPLAGSGATYAFKVTATDGVNPAATQSFTLTVDEAPAITSAASTTFTVGTAGTFKVTATGFPKVALSDGGAKLPTGVTFVDNGDGTATLAGTAAGAGGMFPITVTAMNGVSPAATQSFALTVDQVSRATGGCRCGPGGADVSLAALPILLLMMRRRRGAVRRS